MCETFEVSWAHVLFTFSLYSPSGPSLCLSVIFSLSCSPPPAVYSFFSRRNLATSAVTVILQPIFLSIQRGFCLTKQPNTCAWGWKAFQPQWRYSCHLHHPSPLAAIVYYTTCTSVIIIYACTPEAAGQRTLLQYKSIGTARLTF